MSPPTAHPIRSSRAWLEVGVSVLAAAVFDRVVTLAELPGLAYAGYGAAVLIIAMRRGLVPALFVGLFVAAFHGYRSGDRSLDIRIAELSVLFGIAATGYIIDRYRARITRLQRVIASMRREPSPSESRTSSERRPRTGNLPRLLYRYARLLNVTDEKAIYNGLAIVVHEALPADAVAVYLAKEGGLRHIAGDPLAPPPHRPTGDEIVELAGGRAMAMVRNGVGGEPAAVLLVEGPGQGIDRPRALQLLAVFIEWASAGIAHARTLRESDEWSVAESARRAEARGRASAARFARTGRLDIVGASQPSDPSGRAPRPARMPIAAADTTSPEGSPHETTAEDDATERIDARVVDIARLDAARAKRKATGIRTPSVLIEPAPPPPSAHTDPERNARDLMDAQTEIEAPGPPMIYTPSDTPPEAELPFEAPPDRAAEVLAPDVRAAIERMAGRLAVQSDTSGEGDDDEMFGGFGSTDMEQFGLPASDEDMVPADELPLIGGASFGVGIAREVGRSAIDDKFARLLANLSDHLDRDD